MSRLLIHDYPLMVSPKLAVALGLNEAIFLQQLHYWLGTSGKERRGRKWVYNTYQEWQVQLPFWGVRTVRRTVEALESAGLVDSTDEFNLIKSDRTKWYTINYAAVSALEIGLPKNAGHVDKLDRPCGQIGQLLESGQNGQLLPERDLPSETSLPASTPDQEQPTKHGKPGAVAQSEKTTDQKALAFFDGLAGYGFCSSNRQHLVRWYEDYSSGFLQLAWKLAPTVKDVRVPRVAFVWLLNREKAWPDELTKRYGQDQKVPVSAVLDVPFVGEIRVTKDGRSGRVTEVDADERKLSLQIGEDAAESLWIPWAVTEPAVRRAG